jgi:hypothetical protein
MATLHQQAMNYLVVESCEQTHNAAKQRQQQRRHRHEITEGHAPSVNVALL